MKLITTAVVFVLLSLLHLARAACYYPDGSVSQDQPCTDSTGETACCATGYACVGLSSLFYICKPTGFEYNAPDPNPYARGSCTDKTWRSPNCPSMCVSGGRDNLSGGQGVNRCPGSQDVFYCMSKGLGIENCTTGYNVFKFPAEPTALTTIGISPTSTARASSTGLTPTATLALSSPTPALSSGITNPSPSADQSAAASSSPSRNTIVGVGVGVSIGGLGLIAGTVALWLFLRHRGRSTDDTATHSTGETYAQPHFYTDSRPAELSQDFYHTPEDYQSPKILTRENHRINELPSDRFA